MLRIRHFSYDDRQNPWVGGGGAHRLHEIYRALGDQVDVIVTTGNYPGAREGLIDGVRYERVGSANIGYALSRVSFAAAANMALRRAVYDVAFVEFSAYTFIEVPRERPVALVLGQLVSPTARERWGTRLGGLVAKNEQRMLRRARWVTAVSRSLHDEVRPHLAAGTIVEVVGGGVPTELLEAERAPEDYLLYFGRFDVFQKGLDLLFEAAPAIIARHPGLRVVVAGRGRDEAEVRRRAATIAGLEVVRDDSASDGGAQRTDLMRRARAVIVPSRFEGFGLVAAEAMAAGAPVIASRIAAFVELVPPGTGHLFESGSVDALVAAVDEALTAGDLPAARSHARAFAWPSVAQQHLSFARRVAQSPRPRSA